jgi:DNA processing protein
MQQWLTLFYTKGLGLQTIHSLLATFTSLDDFFAASEQQWQALGLTKEVIYALRHPNQEQIASDLKWMEQPDCTIIAIADPRYPTCLRNIAIPPLLLFIKGNADILTHPQLAIVGSRHPTVHGIKHAYCFAEQLAKAGLCITSGMARGIDAASHQGAMAGSGLTLAVLGTGVDCIYPKEHARLAQSIIAAGGALVSEFPLGMPPIAANFPRRNRIIAGMSLAV